MIQAIYETCSNKTVSEMIPYLKSEIEKYPIESYKGMSVEMKIYLHKIYSFLWFCNECDDRAEVLKCMKVMSDTKGFYDRSKLVNKVKV